MLLVNQVIASSAVRVVIAFNGARAQPVHVDHLLLLGKLLSARCFTGMVEHPRLVFCLIVHDFACAPVWFVDRAWLQRPELLVPARLPTD